MTVPPRTRGVLQQRAHRSFLVRELALPAQQFVHTEVGGGLALIAAVIVALIWANSPWSQSYTDLWHTALTLDLAVVRLSLDLRHWINDGLMALFFLVVGMEIKQEVTHGELSSLRHAALPVISAAGGMAVPALIFVAFNFGRDTIEGWAVPAATDIAFALGILALAGRGIPSGARTFLLGVAVADDIGGILVIAVFYTAKLSLAALGLAAAVTAAIWVLLRTGTRSNVLYVVLAIVLWTAVHESGVHATIAGVVLGALVPVRAYYDHGELEAAARGLLDRFRAARQRGAAEEAEALVGQLEELSRGTESSLERLERVIHPWSSYFVIPLFALANAGISVEWSRLQAAAVSPAGLGVFLGLVAGKPLGILGAAWLASRFDLITLPAGVRWAHLAGVGALAGIGFTVAIFIATLAFADEATLAHAKSAILAASLAAGLIGYTWLRLRTGSAPTG